MKKAIFLTIICVLAAIVPVTALAEGEETDKKTVQEVRIEYDGEIRPFKPAPRLKAVPDEMPYTIIRQGCYSSEYSVYIDEDVKLMTDTYYRYSATLEMKEGYDIGADTKVYIDGLEYSDDAYYVYYEDGRCYMVIKDDIYFDSKKYDRIIVFVSIAASLLFAAVILIKIALYRNWRKTGNT